VANSQLSTHDRLSGTHTPNTHPRGLPNGKISRNWQPARSRDGLPIIQATFRQPDCRPCPDRA
jgi:hypothetical protein